MSARRSCSILTALGASLALGPGAAAHDLAVRATLAPPAVVAQALYGASEPVAFAKVTIHAPGAARDVYQTGNADAQGYFCFRPAGPGEWRITMDDEMGHVEQASVTVPRPFVSSAAPPVAGTGPSRLERAALGLSLLIGLSGFWYGFRARRS
jgi:hypothetical protein